MGKDHLERKVDGKPRYHILALQFHPVRPSGEMDVTKEDALKVARQPVAGATRRTGEYQVGHARVVLVCAVCACHGCAPAATDAA